MKRRRWLRWLLTLAAIIIVACTALMLWNLRPPAVAEPAASIFELRPPSSSSATPPIRLRVVTWNVWGLHVLSPRRAERLPIIARETAKLKPDIVGFQEAYVQADRLALQSALAQAGLPYTRYFPSGLVGSGLFLVSRYPIESDGFVRFTQNGRPEMLQHGDWWAGKGISLSTIRLPNGLPLFVGNTHFHARYNSTRYHPTQLAQAAQVIPLAKQVLATGCPSLWFGDWNSPSDSDVVAPIVEAGGWQLLNQKTPGIDHIFAGGSPGFRWQISKEGVLKGHLSADDREFGGKKIDHRALVPWSDHACRWVDVELSQVPPNLNNIPTDLTVPPVSSGTPAVGKRVIQTTTGWEKTAAHHTLYLPTDWQQPSASSTRYPVLVEYPGNGGYQNKLGDTSDGTVEGCVMGYGLSGGRGRIWISLPFLEKNIQGITNTPKWWGDVEETKRYCMATVREVCQRYGGDETRLVLMGFSRGAIACNYIGLHDDSIAPLWRGLFAHSHYEGEFKHPAPDEAAWPARLRRLGSRPLWISQELSTSATKETFARVGIQGQFTFAPLSFPNHSARWLLCATPLRDQARAWLQDVLK